MSKIRVKLDLSHFYVDKKRFAYVLIDPEWKNVKCLQRHVENLFRLSRIEFVTEDSCYLPPREHISVVNSRDVLRVLEKKHTDFIQNELKTTTTEIMPTKQKKFNKLKECNVAMVNNLKLEAEAGQGNRKTRKRKYPAEDVQKPNCGVITDAALSVKKLKSIFDQKIEEAEKSTQNSYSSKGSTLSNSVDEKKLIKPKRKRKRKKKSKETSEVIVEDSFKNHIFINKKCIVSTPIANAKPQEHIRFDDDGKTLVHVEKNQFETTSIIFKSYLDNLCKSKARIIKGTVIYNSTDQNGIRADQKDRCSFEISQENETVIPNIKILSSTDENNHHIEALPFANQKETQDHNEENNYNKTAQETKKIIIENMVCVKSYNVENNHHDEELSKQIINAFPVIDKVQNEVFSTENILNLSEPLLGEPAIGDILIFKIYRLSECSEPSLSDFICGKYEGIDESTKLMKIFLVGEIDKLTNMELNGSAYLYLKYEDLIDKRVFRM